MDSALINALVNNVLELAVTVGVGFLLALIKQKLGTEKLVQLQQQMELKQGLAYDTVAYVAQVYKHLDGPDKLKAATNQFIYLAAEKGINVSEDEVRVLLESAYRAAKNAWSEAI